MGEVMPADPLERMERGLRFTSWLWAIGVIVTIAGVWILKSGTLGGRDRVHLEQALFTAWTLGPPAWFVTQRYLWSAPTGGQDRFRSHLALVEAVWAGVVAFLAAIIFGRWG